MKIRSFSSLLFIALAVRLGAITPVPYLEAVSFTSTITGTGTSTLTVYGEAIAGTSGTVTVTDNVTSATHESDQVIALFRPGKTCRLNFSGSGPGSYQVSITAPTGYAVYVDGQPKDLIARASLSGSYSYDYNVEIRPAGAGTGAAWGAFSGIALGKAVSWDVGLGGLRNGNPAGSIMFREIDLSGNNAVRDRLYYTPPTNYLQITVVKDGPSNQRLRQVAVPSGIVDLVDVTNGYDIRFYTTSQGAWSSGLYTFTGSPWKTIAVTSTAGGQMQVVETEGTTVNTSLLTETGQVATGIATGGTITTSGGSAYTIHTFTAGGTFTLNSATSVDYLVVGGGGGGGDAVVQHFAGGGGGAGSVQYSTGQSLAAGTYAVTVGAGGAHGANGSNSTFNGITAYGGGHGRSSNASPTSGGSGGGGSANSTGAAAGSGSNVNAGGYGDNGAHAYQGGGGGGAGAAGGGLYTGGNFNGGSGLSNSISGSTTYYGGGGGGGTGNGYNPTTGGAGGGGGNPDGKGGTSATANTGGGGGGAGYDNLSGTPWNGGAGGSGVVIIRYAGGQAGNFTRTLKEKSGGATWKRTTTQVSSVPTVGQRDTILSVYEGDSTASGDLVVRTKHHFVNKAWGEELDQVIADPDGAALTTVYAYYETAPVSNDPANRGSYRRIKSVTQPTGNWVAYDYYDDYDHRGQAYHEYRPFLDSPATVTLNTALGCVVQYNYTYDWTGRWRELYTREEKIGGVTTALLTRNQNYDSATTNPRDRYQQLDSASGSQYVLSYVEAYRADADSNYIGLPVVVVQPTGAKDVFFYAAGFYDPATKGFSVNGNGTEWKECRFHGTGTTADGGEPVSTYQSWSIDTIHLIPNKSTQDVIIRSAYGAVLRTETWVYTGSGSWSSTPMTSEDFTYDAQTRLTQRVASNGATTVNAYANGRLTGTTGVDGTETQFTYDNLGRVGTSIKKGVSLSGSYLAQGDITTAYTYDAANHVLQQLVSGAGGSPSLATSGEFDKAGRPKRSVAPGGYATDIVITGGGKIVSATLPGGATKVSESYLDGRPKSVTGTAVVASYEAFWINSGGTATHRSRTGADTSTSPYVEITADWLGRPVTEVRPAPPGVTPTTLTSTSTYNANGLLSKRTQPGLADMLYLYDTMGVLTYSGLDVNANGTLDLASSDRITSSAWSFFPSGSNWWQRKTTSTYATTGNATPTQISKTETQISGLPTNRLSRIDSYDIFGNGTTQVVDVNRSGKIVTTTTDVPDSTTDVVQIAYNGETMSSRDQAGNTTTFAYDGLGRLISKIDPRTGADRTVYRSTSSEVDKYYDPYANAQFAGNTSFLPTITYHYDSAGRVDWTQDAVGKKAYTEYGNRNEVKRQWGDTAIPVEYVYDNWGRQTAMKSYRAGTGWTLNSWPTAPGTADWTTWVFDQSTGLLKEKYNAANLDGSGNPISGAKKIAYTYNQAGQLKTRTWQRGVTTTYYYYGEGTGEPVTGELRKIDYSDSTTDVEYTYNRLGKTSTVLDAALTRTFNYNLGGTLELQSEDLPSFFGSRRVSYPHATTGVIGRSTGLQLGTSSSPTADQSVAYGYDAYGRFNSIAGGGTTLAYGYTSNSNLLASITDSSSGWTQSRTYLSNRDLLDVIETKVGTSSKTKFDYAYDDLGRRSGVAKTGDLFTRYGSGGQGLDTTYGYDDRSQIISEGTNLGGTTTPLTGRADTYAWDNFGNRSSSNGTVHNGSPNIGNYTTNALNQYTQRTMPAVFDVAGGAPAATTVTVNGSSSGVTRHGEYFFKGESQANSTGPVFSSIPVSAGSTSQFLAFTAMTPEPFSYDADGNLLRDGRWVYQYDAENRLVAIFTRGAPLDDPEMSDGITTNDAANNAVWNSGVTRQKLLFSYDYLGRRISKQSTEYSSGVWLTTSSEKFVYDGWNVMAELDALSSNALVVSHYWGLDWSGTLQGAGGVGGLAITVEAGKTYLPMYDGNGNVHGLTTTSSVTFGIKTYAAGDIVAGYEYDAFGQTLRESDGYSPNNSFRFSTKFTDLETGLVYYGLRYYSPTLGRFINKDPIEESGGLNLYGFCLNNGVNRWDYLGQTGEAKRTLGKAGDIVNQRWINDVGDGYESDVIGQGVNFYTDPVAHMMAIVGGFHAEAEGALNTAHARVEALMEIEKKLTTANDQNKLTEKQISTLAEQILAHGFQAVLDGYQDAVDRANAYQGAASNALYAATDSTLALKQLTSNLGPKIGNMRYKEASIGVASYSLGQPGKFDEGMAAILNFADAMDNPLSPYSLSHGLPPDIFSKALGDRIDTIWDMVDRTGQGVSPGISDTAGNYLRSYRDLMNKVDGPWQAFTITQTQTYSQTSSFFGLFKSNQWVDGPKVYTPVETGPAAGFFYSPSAAAAAAKTALKKQLNGGSR